ncbi:hypothetical protein PAGA_a0344 [Pseudoalteromonas agarivorans DSM 14585]|uniref:Uncharacterized protein n=1 Tax=Pseudoalteromonas agarivorans DSM 14585 TaxID=1312369 RepID=A0ACA8DSW6_9GAMM|nr:hypothetical protein PAGA_a0344 [Pseudoalteromonas agarivorans DSM 14585]
MIEIHSIHKAQHALGGLILYLVTHLITLCFLKLKLINRFV